MGYTIDIDTGGTFTDGFFVFNDQVETVKVPTTPHDLTVCFLECIKAGAVRFGVKTEDLLYETDIIRFPTQSARIRSFRETAVLSGCW